MAFEAVQNRLAYYSALRHPEHEQADICGDLPNHVLAAAVKPHPSFDMAAREGAALIGGGRVLKKVRGMGTIYDWRGTAWSAPNGGVIQPLVFVQHIPVVPNMAGIADFVRLRDVLVAQGLMVHNATDREGNIALYTPMDRLCYQARGANQVSCGTEHMHMTLGESWSKVQLRASAWLVNLAKEKHGVPAHQGTLAAGSGVARVAKRGQTTHQRVSDAAGFHDRSDPGAGYDFEYVYHCVGFYRAHGHFEGA